MWITSASLQQAYVTGLFFSQRVSRLVLDIINTVSHSNIVQMATVAAVDYMYKSIGFLAPDSY